MVRFEVDKMVITISTGGQPQVYRQRMMSSLISTMQLINPDAGDVSNITFPVLELLQCLIEEEEVRPQDSVH